MKYKIDLDGLEFEKTDECCGGICYPEFTAIDSEGVRRAEITLYGDDMSRVSNIKPKPSELPVGSVIVADFYGACPGFTAIRTFSGWVGVYGEYNLDKFDTGTEFQILHRTGEPE